MYTFLTFGIGETEFETYSADYVDTMTLIHSYVQEKEKRMMKEAKNGR